VPGKGGPGTGGAEAGDLFLRVRLAAHPDFEVRGADLFHDLDLAPWEAVLGARLVVPTLAGSVKLNIPAGTTSGRQLRIRGQGLPKGTSGERGDLYAVARIHVPTQLSTEEKALWEKLAKTSTFDPRSAETGGEGGK
jgi:curved DNA-binding protein